MIELSLFSGAGGGVLGTQHLLGWRTVGYVEIEEYCQRVLRRRIDDGVLDQAPIFGDIKAFIGNRYAAGYQGMVDVVSAGFPCQPFSVAGKQAGADDARNMWPATIECIRLVRPRYVYLENVPGLLASRKRRLWRVIRGPEWQLSTAVVEFDSYFGHVLGELSESGYDARWRVLSAAEMGAPHRRDRLWVVAEGVQLEGEQSSGDQCVGHCGAGLVSDTEGAGREEPRRGVGAESEHARSPDADWWEVEPDVGRVVDGLASRVDRVRALGNGQVPAVVAGAWRLLMDGKDFSPRRT